MTTLSYTTPVPGTDLNSIADPEIATALNAIKTWANGNIDTSNVKTAVASGLLAARPAASTVAVGAFYYATDKSILYVSDGTNWNTMLAGGAWQNLTLGGSVSASSGYTPAARQEGDLGRLTGALSVAAFSSGATLATVPSGVRPTSAVSFGSSASGGVGTLAISTGGVITLTSASGVGAPITVPLEGLTFRLS